MTSSTPRTILVADDEPQVRKMVRAILEQRGYRVLEASSGEQAVALSHDYDGPIDLALIDVGMPVMGGLDLANLLIPQRPAMKVLYISGMVDSVAVKSLATGAPHLIVPKPFTPAELLDRIRAVLEPGQ